MSATFDAAELERFKRWVRGRIGFQLDASGLEPLADILRERLRETGATDFEAYDQRLGAPTFAQAELRAVARRLTVGETYFFRNPDQLAAFTEECVLARARAGSKVLRILSAGCASGEEAYTLAMLVREHVPDLRSWAVTIRGIDINVGLLEKARLGRYSAWALRQTADAHRARYFKPDGRDFVLSDDIRGMVAFEARNLVDDDPELWRAEAFDVIFFRNVLIYFSPEATRAVVTRLTASLAPGGHLFLGDAETLRNVSHDFHLRHTHGAFYYQLKGSAEPRSGAPVQAAPGAPGRPPLLASDDSWVDAIRRASERIARLADDPPSGATAVSAPTDERAEARARPEWSLAPATELLRQERFGDALELLRHLPPESSSDADVQLLRAALLTQRGEIPEAERACALVLELDELNAGAHYLKALCREHAGDRRAAVDHDQTALHLDPRFAMPRLHLGLLARRSGDLEGARRELAYALDLLEREDSSRILLFGGGFNREALLLLCRAELGACGGVA